MTKAVAFQPLDTFQINKMTESSEHSFNKVTSYGQLFAFDDLHEGDSHPEDNVLDSTTKIRLEWLVSPKSSLEASVSIIVGLAGLMNLCLQNSLTRSTNYQQCSSSKTANTQPNSPMDASTAWLTLYLA